MAQVDMLERINYVLMANLSQIRADADWSNTWSNSSAEKTKMWLAGDTINGHTQAIHDWINGLSGSASDILTALNTHCPCRDGSIPGFSIEDWDAESANQLYQHIIALIPSDPDQAKPWAGVPAALGSFTNMISSAQSADTTPIEGMTSTMRSQLTTDNSNPQSMEDYFQDWVQYLETLNNQNAQAG